MYVPKQFQEHSIDVLTDAVRAIGLACVVTHHEGAYHATHIPMFLRQDADGGWLLEAHVARGNPHWAALARPVNSVAIFQGPHAYVSPGWYASKREHGKVVPTWNYIAVHAEGLLVAIQDEAWLADHLDDLTAANEAGRADAWTVSDAPDDYIAGMRRGIVGVRMRVERLQGAWKMIQHRSEGDRSGVIRGMEETGLAGAGCVASVMRDLEKVRSEKGS
jgi:transcriptional regulator